MALVVLMPASAYGAGRFPTVSSVSPSKARIGEKLTIRGSNFIVGKQKTTVVFQRAGRKPVFARAEISTKTLIQITVPPTLATVLDTKNGYAQYTPLRIRVLTKRLGVKFFARAVTVGPEGSASVDIDECARIRTGADGSKDLDGDFLTNAEELGLVNRLDPCNKDTDGDGLEDGWEYFSAKDLNQRAVPYPGKRPFPNPLDPVEPGAAYDYDGDGLTTKQEFELWKAYGRSSQTSANREDLLYSDGTQTSAGPGPSQLADLSKLQVNATSCGYTVVPPSLGYLGIGYVASSSVTDDEKDADQDGLGNWAEATGTMTQAWWQEFFATGQYPRRNFADTTLTDADIDGDGCIDGLDDQDNDDFPNWMEYGDYWGTWADGATTWFAQTASFGSWTGWAPAPAAGVYPYVIHPFNPCLPNVNSRTCSRYVSKTYAPFVDDFRDATCRQNITYRGQTISTWVWDPVKDELPPEAQPATTTAPAVPSSCPVP